MISELVTWDKPAGLDDYSVEDILYIIEHLTMTDLIFITDPTVPGSTFQNRTIHPCDKEHFSL